ncbi:hypothetical protein BDQ17DRAFT_1335341 [Cyathus striatus]|nr:hypothetical protein BDQ17DRAFT_1335341 [Cyathus striatus]
MTLTRTSFLQRNAEDHHPRDSRNRPSKQDSISELREAQVDSASHRGQACCSILGLNALVQRTLGDLISPPHISTTTLHDSRRIGACYNEGKLNKRRLASPNVLCVAERGIVLVGTNSEKSRLRGALVDVIVLRLLRNVLPTSQETEPLRRARVVQYSSFTSIGGTPTTKKWACKDHLLLSEGGVTDYASVKEDGYENWGSASCATWTCKPRKPYLGSASGIHLKPKSVVPVHADVDSRTPEANRRHMIHDQTWGPGFAIKR